MTRAKSVGERARDQLLKKERVLKFRTIKGQREAVKILYLAHTQFSYIGDEKYIISRHQCDILKEAGIPYTVLSKG